MTRANGIAYAVFFLLLLFGLRSGCGLLPETTVQRPVGGTELPNAESTYPNATVEQAVAGTVPHGALILGSFNIQVFGVAKSNDPFRDGAARRHCSTI